MTADHLPENQHAGSASGPTPWEGVASVPGDAPPARRGHPEVPDALARRYLRIDNRYFFLDRTLAFIDDGARLRVRTENREVLRTVVAIAEARGWRAIELQGTESFRQDMWREAVRRGIEVRGYEPTQVEILQLQRAAKGKRFWQETGQDPIPEPLVRDATVAPEDAVATQRDQPSGHRPVGVQQERPYLHRGPPPPIRGMLMAAAGAPYRFDPAQRMSFYVMVRTQAGVRTIWGVDLERAIAESASQPHIGDEVVITQHGTRPVNVRVAARTPDGERVGEKKILVQRARWSVETSDHHRAMERRAKQVRTGELLSDSNGAQHPELAMAAANLKLAEQYARRVTGSETSRQRLVQLIRERMAEALEQGRAIHLPNRRLQPTPVHARHRTARGPEEFSHERI